MLKAPLGDSSAVLAPTDLGGRFFTLTERRWSNAVLCAFLLEDPVRIMELSPAADGVRKNRLLEDALESRTNSNRSKRT